MGRAPAAAPASVSTAAPATVEAAATVAAGAAAIAEDDDMDMLADIFFLPQSRSPPVRQVQQQQAQQRTSQRVINGSDLQPPLRSSANAAAAGGQGLLLQGTIQACPPGMGSTSRGPPPVLAAAAAAPVSLASSLSGRDLQVPRVEAWSEQQPRPALLQKPPQSHPVADTDATAAVMQPPAIAAAVSAVAVVATEVTPLEAQELDDVAAAVAALEEPFFYHATPPAAAVPVAASSGAAPTTTSVASSPHRVSRLRSLFDDEGAVAPLSPLPKSPSLLRSASVRSGIFGQQLAVVTQPLPSPLPVTRSQRTLLPRHGQHQPLQTRGGGASPQLARSMSLRSLGGGDLVLQPPSLRVFPTTPSAMAPHVSSPSRGAVAGGGGAYYSDAFVSELLQQFDEPRVPGVPEVDEEVTHPSH